MLQRLRRQGLDIVIVFDSTGSMGGEIRQVKSQIQNIGSTLVKLVPKARISLVTYRDRGDEYVVQTPILPLTGDLQRVATYLSAVDAGGGGDREEAVQEGLRFAVEENQFRPAARKVILLFGDAPPHAQDQTTCLRIASDFSRRQKGRGQHGHLPQSGPAAGVRRDRSGRPGRSLLDHGPAADHDSIDGLGVRQQVSGQSGRSVRTDEQLTTGSSYAASPPQLLSDLSDPVAARPADGRARTEQHHGSTPPRSASRSTRTACSR